ncbi:hypothetical protein sscle_05g045170 [Sclerotinia sclerotiorum 1980 UF-70]|uniref:Uncharacterized protein n=1 Tax=Sclerotinia sclerotiorum (strain ATCC 18683 / 1980 / Ss-1) TaxID=665079 RepID=A0A1D9Q490_SCLS1|nr:hypothetical protein sscle_05g045170 [Sclerotinia sclerotiorum 1980 UF-70]
MGATQMPATKSSWSPYAQLIRLEKPVGIVIIHFPYIVGSLYAACLSQPRIALQDVAQINFLLLCGTFLLRSWACAWNDIVDRDLDKLVERCKQRPMASGKLSVRNACLFTGFLCLVWLALMKILVSSFLTHGVALLVFSGVYPFTKRFTAYTPVWLGLTFAWGVFVGFAATGLDPVQLLLSSEEFEPAIKGALLLFVYYTIWTVIFETVYAFQDLPDDTKAGINSMAVRHQFHIRELLGILGIAQVAVLFGLGKVLEASSLYYFGPPLFNIVMLFRMVTGIDFRSAEQCRWWFGHGPLMAGVVLVGSLCIEYLGRIGMMT